MFAFPCRPSHCSQGCDDKLCHHWEAAASDAVGGGEERPGSNYMWLIDAAVRLVWAQPSLKLHLARFSFSCLAVGGAQPWPIALLQLLQYFLSPFLLSSPPHAPIHSKPLRLHPPSSCSFFSFYTDHPLTRPPAPPSPTFLAPLAPQLLLQHHTPQPSPAPPLHASSSSSPSILLLSILLLLYPSSSFCSCRRHFCRTGNDTWHEIKSFRARATHSCHLWGSITHTV